MPPAAAPQPSTPPPAGLRLRFKAWWSQTFDDWFFRSMIGPAQTKNAIQGCDESAREQWKRDLEARKQYTRDQRAKRAAGR